MTDSARRVLDPLAHAIAHALAVPLVLITVVDPAGHTIAGAYSSRGLHRAAPSAPMTPQCRQVLVTGKPVIVPDARRRATGTDAALEVVGYAGLPIVVDSVVVGAIAAIDHQAHSWTDRDVELLRQFAELAAIALDQALALDRERSLAALLVHAANATNLREVLEALVRHTGCTSAEVVTIDSGRARSLAAYDADHGEPPRRSDHRREALAVAIPGGSEVLELFVDDVHANRAELTRVASAVAALLGAVLARLRPEHGNARRTGELEILALHDELTGLLNRRGFLAVAGGQLALARRKAIPGIVLFIDLDGLKEVNDVEGHAAGDSLLRRAAGVLRATFRESDTIARVGGDELVVFSIDATDHDLVAVTGRLTLEVDRVNRLAAPATALRWSIGFVAFDGASIESLDTLLSEADRRMYASKRGNRARTSTDVS